MELVLDGRTIDSRETLHRKLKEGLSLPSWYGRNLDALHDCLTELCAPVTIRVLHAAHLSEALGGYAAGFYHVLQDSAHENEYLKILWEE